MERTREENSNGGADRRGRRKRERSATGRHDRILCLRHHYPSILPFSDFTSMTVESSRPLFTTTHHATSAILSQSTMASLNTSQNGAYISTSYQKVVNSPLASGPAASSPTYAKWALYSVQAPLVSAFQSESGKESVLKVQTTAEGELIDLIEDFNDGRIQFAFVKVKDPNTTLPKSVLIAWCGEGVPERTKGYFTSHMNAVSKILHGYHVQITARSDSDLSPDSIVQKVADASGSKYSGGGAASGSSSASGRPPPVASKPVMPTKSFGASGGYQALGSRSRPSQQGGKMDEDGWGEDAPPVMRSQLEKVASAYKPTKVDLGALQAGHEPSRYQPPQRSDDGGANVVKGGYQPVGKVDINAIRQQAKESGSMQDDRPTTVKGAYQPVGKVDIADIRRRTQGAAEPSQPAMSPQPSGTDHEKPKPVADRSAAFPQGERLTSMPRPGVANRFSSQASSFTGTKAPQPGGFEAKAPPPSVAPVGTASKTFADEGGKTPAQVWAEKKARERGASGGAEARPPMQPQTSGGWQSGYGGKKWGVNLPTRTGGSGVGSQHSGQDESAERAEEPTSAASAASGGIGSIRDRFQDAAPEPPRLDPSSKPSADNRGAPTPPDLQQRPPSPPRAHEPQDLPPPPSRGIPADEADEADDDAVPQTQGSPVQIAMPVARTSTPAPLPKAAELPPQPLPTDSLEHTLSQHRSLSPERPDDPARAAGVAAAATTFGSAADAPAPPPGRAAIAQYDYDRAEDNELELRDGDRITDIDMVDEDWWMGRNPRGDRGLFPANYVELEPEGADGAPANDATPSAAAGPSASPAAPAAPAAPPAPSAIAQYDYDAEEDNELTFPDGARIENIVSPVPPVPVPVPSGASLLTTPCNRRNSPTPTGGWATTAGSAACSRLTTWSSRSEGARSEAGGLRALCCGERKEKKIGNLTPGLLPPARRRRRRLSPPAGRNETCNETSGNVREHIDPVDVVDAVDAVETRTDVYIPYPYSTVDLARPACLPACLPIPSLPVPHREPLQSQPAGHHPSLLRAHRPARPAGPPARLHAPSSRSRSRSRASGVDSFSSSSSSSRGAPSSPSPSSSSSSVAGVGCASASASGGEAAAAAAESESPWRLPWLWPRPWPSRDAIFESIEGELGETSVISASSSGAVGGRRGSGVSGSAAASSSDGECERARPFAAATGAAGPEGGELAEPGEPARGTVGLGAAASALAPAALPPMPRRACTLRRLLAELMERMSGRPSLRISTPSALRVGLLRDFLVALVLALGAAADVSGVVPLPAEGSRAGVAALEVERGCRAWERSSRGWWWRSVAVG